MEEDGRALDRDGVIVKLPAVASVVAPFTSEADHSTTNLRVLIGLEARSIPAHDIRFEPSPQEQHPKASFSLPYSPVCTK